MYIVFPRLQLIFSFGRRVIYHSKGLWEYILKSIPSVGMSVCLSVCTTIIKRKLDFIFILNLWCHTSMDLSQWALQTNGKFFFFYFELVFTFLAENKFFSKEWRGVNIDQIAMFNVSMDSSQRALQNNENIFLQIRFRVNGQKQKILKRIVRREYWFEYCYIYIVIYKWICLDKLYKQMESSSNFELVF